MSVVVLIVDPFIPAEDIAAALGEKLGSVVIGPKALQKLIRQSEHASAKEVASLMEAGGIPPAHSLIRCVLDYSANASSLLISVFLRRRTQLMALEKEVGAPVVVAYIRRSEASILKDMAELSWPAPKVAAWRHAHLDVNEMCELYREAGRLAEVDAEKLSSSVLSTTLLAEIRKIQSSLRMGNR